MRKILLFLLFLFYFWFYYSYAEKIEDVFLDITKDYEHYSILQNLYDKWMIKPDEVSKLNPNKLLTRDEFVWIVMEVSCLKCIKPDTDLSLITKYNKKPYYDVTNDNRYFYCISEAKEIETVKWYNIWYKCDDGTQKPWELPFCINNTITLEEALAVLLRNSSIYKVSDNENTLSMIGAWLLKDSLSKDVSTTNSDWTPYTFYWYFKKWLEIKYLEYDIYWNPKTLNLLEKDSYWNLNPKKAIKKEDFIKMAYIISKMNSCKISNENDNWLKESIWLQIEIYDKSCKKWDNCNKSDLRDNTWEYDFSEEIKTTCNKWIKSYNWYFYNNNTKESDYSSLEYIDNYKFKSEWKRSIRLEVIDNCWNKASSLRQIDYRKNINWNDLWVEIEASPIYWNWPLKVELDSIVSWCNNNCKYIWNFKDGDKWYLKNEVHTFKYPWVYDVELEVIRDDGKTSKAKVNIVVNNNWLWDLLDKYDKNKDWKIDIWDIDTWLKESIWLQIEIYDKSCKKWDNCNKSDLRDNTWEYDFSEEIKTTCNKWIKSYNWYFYNNNTKESDYSSLEYIDNYKFKSEWKRSIRLEVIDNCWNKASSLRQIDYRKNINWNDLWVEIEASPIYWNWPLKVELDSIVSWCNNNCKYIWNFKDGDKWYLKNEVHTFKYPWVYDVELEVIRDDGKTSKAKVNIVVNNNWLWDLLDKYDKNKDWKIDSNDFDNTLDLSKIDSDKDWIFDNNDKCIDVFWVIENSWCPILSSNACNPNTKNTCLNWYICSEKWFCELWDVFWDLIGTCIYPKTWSSIFWNAICDTCPCNNKIDFLRTIRKCDVLFPAIVSPSWQKIFSFWNTYIVWNNQK